jgi:hypothetical protein
MIDIYQVIEKVLFSGLQYQEFWYQEIWYQEIWVTLIV